MPGAADVTAADRSFDAATAVGPTSDPAVFQVDVHPLWTVGDKANGGYLLALLARAAREVGRADGDQTWEPVASTITFLRPPDLGPAVVGTTVLRRGRSAAQVRAVLSQKGHDVADAVVVLATLPEKPARYDGTKPLEPPPPESCVRVTTPTPTGLHVGIMEVLELRLDPEALPFVGPSTTNRRAELQGWTRFADGREPDPLSLLFSVDAVPPPTLLIGSDGWVPTLQMSTYVRARPEPGWLGLRMSAGVVAGGMVDETCVAWDEGGRVVVVSTQLARLRFPDGHD